MTTDEIMRMAMACVSAAIRENNSDSPDSSCSGVANLSLYQAVDTLVAERDALRAALSAPPGYVMVPVEPTPEMVTAMIAAMNVWIKDIGEDADIYAAMIAAAPKEPT